MKHCPKCNQECSDEAKFCDSCGFNFENELICPICKEPFKIGQKRCKKCNTPLPNTEVSVPDEIKKFNWSAFFFTLPWAIGNNIFFVLWIFFPFFGVLLLLPFSIYLGFKGNEISWKRGKLFNGGTWESVEEYNKYQKVWNIVTVVFYSIIIIFYLVGMLMLNCSMKDYKNIGNIFMEEYNNGTFCTQVKEADDSYDLSQCNADMVIAKNKLGNITEILFLEGSIKNNIYVTYYAGLSSKTPTPFYIKLTSFKKDKQIKLLGFGLASKREILK